MHDYVIRIVIILSLYRNMYKDDGRSTHLHENFKKIDVLIERKCTPGLKVKNGTSP